MSKKIKVQAEVEIPIVPNFLRQADGSMLPIEAVAEKGLRQIGKLWVDALVAKSKKRKQPSPCPKTRKKENEKWECTQN